jgi:tetratricopeptide (TPR) repeat protein
MDYGPKTFGTDPVNRHRTGRWGFTLAVIGCLASSGAWALSFNPTETEWAAWPAYCRARYVVSAAGKDSAYAMRIPAGEVSAWQNRMGAAWYALHHHCAGLTYLDRARQTRNELQRSRLLQQSINAQSFTQARTPAEHPMYAVMAYQIGLAYQMSGDAPKAEAAFDQAIKVQPATPVGYQGKASLYREQKRYEDARDVLLEADKVTGGTSAEIKYFLGLVMFDLKSYDEARTYAEQAYELGYPLPGLANKLARAGYPLK